MTRAVLFLIVFSFLFAGCVTQPGDSAWNAASLEKGSCGSSTPSLQKNAEFLLVSTSLENVKLCDAVNASYRVQTDTLYVNFAPVSAEGANCAQCASGQLVTASIPLSLLSGVSRVHVLRDGTFVSEQFMDSASHSGEPFEVHYAYSGGLSPHSGSIDIVDSKAFIRWQDAALNQKGDATVTLSDAQKSRIAAALRKGFLISKQESLDNPPCCDRTWVVLNASLGSQEASVQTAEDLLFQKVAGYTELKDEFDALFQSVKQREANSTITDLIVAIKKAYPDLSSIQECNGGIGCSTDIQWKWVPEEGAYKISFFNGSGDCPAGCIDRQYRWFTAWVNGSFAFENSTENALVQSGSGNSQDAVFPFHIDYQYGYTYSEGNPPSGSILMDDSFAQVHSGMNSGYPTTTMSQNGKDGLSANVTLSNSEVYSLEQSIRDSGFLSSSFDNVSEFPCCSKKWVLLTVTLDGKTVSARTTEEMLFGNLSNYGIMQSAFDGLLSKAQ